MSFKADEPEFDVFEYIKNSQNIVLIYVIKIINFMIK